MAVSLLAASPYMLRYLDTASGAGTDTTLTQARMIDDAAEGPLKSKLLSSPLAGVGAPANVAWSSLVADPSISVFVSPEGAPALISYGWALVGGGNVHTLSLAAAGAGGAVVEIRFNHSFDR